MNRPRRTAVLGSLVAVAAIAAWSPWTGGLPRAWAAQDAAPATPAAAADDQGAAATATAEVGDLTITAQRDGTIDSAARTKIRFVPEAFSGSLKVAEVVHRAGPVAQNQVLVRLDAAELEKAARAAGESLEDAERSLDLAQQERQNMLEQHKLAMERSEWAAVAAQHAYEMFQKAESENMLKGAELSLQGQENNLSNQREELEQLEQMYKGTELSGETKEIVLERARRNIRLGEQYLDIARDNLQLTREYRHPDRQREITQQQRWTATDLELLKVSQQLADIRSQASIQNAERALRDARERSDKLQRDLQLAQITAPSDGIITRIDLQAGDSVNNGAVLCELIDPHHLVATFSAKEEDLRVLAPGSTVRITLPAFGEVEVTGEVTELAAIGTPAGGGADGASFPTRADLRGSHDLLRVGQKCTIHSEKTLTGILRIPAKAVTSRDGTRYVNVVDAGGARREIEVAIGARGEEWVQVVSGLEAGDVVALPDPKPADGGQ